MTVLTRAMTKLDHSGQATYFATVSTPTPPVRRVREAVGLYEAKTHLSALVDRVAAGEEIVVMKSGRPMARLVPMEGPRERRVPGQGAGHWVVAEDFDAPLPPDVLDAFHVRDER